MVETEKRDQLLTALMDPRAYPQVISNVEMVETLISFLFFAGDCVYKVKKPVEFGYLNFTTLDKRRYYCHQEVELNCRTSPEVYFGVEEIREQDGRYTVGGPGRTVEYAVKMRRLQPDTALEHLLEEGRVSLEDIAAIAAKIARFHDQAKTGPEITALGNLEAVRQNVEENFAQIERFVGNALSKEVYDDLVAYSRAFMEARSHVFRARAEQGRIRDCHGDLHVAQIFLEAPADSSIWDGISIIDCIEFNERFRCSDVAEDIAFLAMDLDFHGRPDLSLAFVEAYARESGDEGVFDFLDFFKAYRALVRAKVACFRTEQPHCSKDDKSEALETARAYFKLAHSYIPMLPTPAVIIVCGVTGTGKSTLATELGRRRAMEQISSDLVRKTLAGIDPLEHRYESFKEGIYSLHYTTLTYDAMLSEARRCLLEGKTVILDGTFRRSKERARAMELAQELGVDSWVVQCMLAEAEARRRLERRMERDDSVSDGRWELYQLQLAEWEPVAEVLPNRHIILDTGGSPEETIMAFLKELYSSILRAGPDARPATL